MTLKRPSELFGKAQLATTEIDPSTLVRISRYTTSEPYFGKTGGNRFDDPRSPAQFGTSYFGFSLACAFAETVLHDEVADVELGGFPLVMSEIESRFVLSFTGEPLRVAVLHGLPLKKLGADGSLSTITPFAIPQAWSLAVHNHPETVDGFLYMSRNLNTAVALVLFDRAKPKLQKATATSFRQHPGAAQVLTDFNVLLR